MQRATRWGAPVLALAMVGTPGEALAQGDLARSDHVVVISIDGLRPDAIEVFGLPTLERLMAEGSYTLEASTIMPSKTLPSHTSMLTGLTPEQHGITFNQSIPENGIVQVPTIFELAREQGLHTAAFFSKAKFRHLDRPDSYVYRQVPAFNVDNWMATRTVPDAVQYLQHHSPHLLFIHIGEPDYAGHGTGWMSFFYGMAARRADAGVARILEAAEEAYGAGQFTVIITADHGGHGHSHGSDDPRDMTIPWIAHGKGVKVDGRPAGVRTMDTAATALWLLGVPAPAGLDGTPVYDAFTVVAPAVVESR